MPRAFFLFVLFLLIVLGLAWSDPERAEIVDLGVARYPSEDLDARSVPHEWNAPREGQPFRVGYAHGAQAKAALRADHDRFAASLGFRWIDGNAFNWQMPPECVGREWHCIYPAVHARSLPDLEPLLDRIDRGFQSQSFTAREAAAWLLDLVQRIPYRLPTKEAFGLRPPALVVSEDWGDCDSKSLLLIRLLERVGIEGVLIVSEAHAHALVGIAVPTSGDGHRHRGREYAWAETTAERAPLGWLHPRLRVPDDWRVVPIR